MHKRLIQSTIFTPIILIAVQSQWVNLLWPQFMFRSWSCASPPLVLSQLCSWSPCHLSMPHFFASRAQDLQPPSDAVSRTQDQRPQSPSVENSCQGQLAPLALVLYCLQSSLGSNCLCLIHSTLNCDIFTLPLSIKPLKSICYAPFPAHFQDAAILGTHPSCVTWAFLRNHQRGVTD